MNYRPYESTSHRRTHRNWGNEHAILAAGICAFISSFFANIATSSSFIYTHLFFAPLLVIIYLFLYWLYGKCYELILNNSKLSKVFFGGSYREEITHVVAETIPTDLYHLLVDLKGPNEGKELLSAKACYEIANILDYLSENAHSFYIDCENPSDLRPSSSFVSIVTLNAIFNGIDELLEYCKSPKTISQEQEQPEHKNGTGSDNQELSELKIETGSDNQKLDNRYLKLKNRNDDVRKKVLTVHNMQENQ